MKRILIGVVIAALLAGISYAFIVYISGVDVPVLQPKGYIGKKELELIIVSVLLMLVVVIPVFVLTFYFASKYRDGNEKAKYQPDWEHSYLAESIWWGIPIVIICILAGITWVTTHDLSPYRPIENGRKPIKIQAVALEWKWLFIYPEEGIATVNYIQFPKDVPINFEITANAPMNSFWIPQLGGQIYAMPSMRTKLHLIADEEGTFRGVSSNFSGKGFAGMNFTAKATSDKSYKQWLRKVKSVGKGLTQGEYQRLSAPSSYNPVELFSSTDPHMFDAIVDQYQNPNSRY